MAVASPLAVDTISTTAAAQTTDLGSVNVAGAAKPAKKKVKQAQKPVARRTTIARPTSARNAAPAVAATVPIQSDNSIGSGAPAGSAPALAPSQSSLNTSEPSSVVSDKVLRDVVKTGADYNEAAKYTPSFVSNNPNGIGDSKSGWRGFADGQFNITFDGIPFGDANDPTHHSAAYFPASFLSRVTIDRGPGAASQIGYAPFGGTMALQSLDLSDTRGASVFGSYGNYNSYTLGTSAQSGYDKDTQARALVAFSRIHTDGVLQYGDDSSTQALVKYERKFGDVKVTALATGGTEFYNNANSITWAQWQANGKNYGQLNDNPKSQQFVGYNNSVKATDMEYIKFEANVQGFEVKNTAYTYSYWYPELQNNGADQTIDGDSSIANKGTIVSVKVPQPNGTSTTTAINGVAPGDVTGYLKYNNYRTWGDHLAIAHDFKGGLLNGQLRTGVWVEAIDNDRYQQYYDYTSSKTYSELGNAANASYKLDLTSMIRNVQPYVEYEWRPTDRLTITPGYKYESFTRIHDASVNQTTLAVMNYTHTYSTSLPFLAGRYRLTDDLSVYAQASKGFLAPTVSAYYVFNPDTNSSIAPQTTTNYQTGVVYKTERITAAFDAYRVTATNFPVTSTVAGLTYYQNGGTARYQGLEAEGTYKIFNGFAAYASGALIQAKFIDGANTGMRVGAAPGYTFATGIVYDDQTYFGSLLYKQVGDQYGSGGQKNVTIAGVTYGDLNKIGSYNATDLVLGIRSQALKRMGIGEKAEFKIGVSNIFDQRNITDISGDPAKIAAIHDSTLGYAFQASRTFYGAVKVDF